MSSKTFYVYAYYPKGSKLPIYVGKGTKDRAWKGLRPSSRTNSPQLQAELEDLKQQGIEVEVEILFKTHDEAEAYAMEHHFVARFGRRNNGTGCLVNVTDGGIGCPGELVSERMREGWRRKNLAAGRTVVVVSPETGEILHEFPIVYDAAKAMGLSRSSIHEALKRPYHVSNGFLFWYGNQGRTFEAYQARLRETKESLRSIRKGMCVGVQQLDRHTGEVIADFSSANEAAAELSGNKSNASCIIEACRGVRDTALGSGWRYANPIQGERQQKRFAPREVKQIDPTTGKTIAVFPSTTAAAKAVSGYSGCVCKAARGDVRTYRGFKWEYAPTSA